MVGVLKFMVSVIVSYFLLQLRPSALFSKRPFSFSPFLVLALALFLFFCFASLRSHSTTHKPTAPKKKKTIVAVVEDARQSNISVILYNSIWMIYFVFLHSFRSCFLFYLFVRHIKNRFFFGAYKSKMEHRV